MTLFLSWKTHKNERLHGGISVSPRVGLTQDHIIEQAFIITEEKGLGHVTMANLARELNVKSPSLYNHFKNLDEVKQRVTSKGLELLFHFLKQQAEASEKGPEMLQAIGNAYIAFADAHPKIYQACTSAPDPKDSRIVKAGEGIVQLVLEALDPFPLSEKEKIHAVRGFRSLLHGLVDLDQKGGFNLPLEMKDTQQFLLTTFIRGLE
ncbi:TetR/AcrR family transcriptional regulator [Halobacillus fulvus]|nr:TetR/AcrR family transcriptional regulator [Halobacillus fulvus]